MTTCKFAESGQRCKRKADSSYKGKAVCNKHLFELRTTEYYTMKVVDNGDI